MSTTAKTVSELCERWGVKPAWVLRQIRSGVLPAKDLTPKGKRPTYRIDESDANKFWSSLSTGLRKNRPRKPISIASIGGLDFDDFR